jgi:hypothetical protein
MSTENVNDIAIRAYKIYSARLRRHNFEQPLHMTQLDQQGCVVKPLPMQLLEVAAQTAIRINPANAPVVGALPSADAMGNVIDPLALAVLTSKYWKPSPRVLTVSFMESTPADLRLRILANMNAWNKTACISFMYTSANGQVRISRETDGYWSYLGTDILQVPPRLPTMSLSGFTTATRESELIRVVRHEAGHVLGWVHEHMRKEVVARIDPEKAYAYFKRTQGWNRQMVNSQVLTPLNDDDIRGTRKSDEDSIMAYRLPSGITRDGLPIMGGSDINATDYAFAGIIYPKPPQTTVAESMIWFAPREPFTQVIGRALTPSGRRRHSR